jgi:hypothetical protein
MFAVPVFRAMQMPIQVSLGVCPAGYRKPSGWFARLLRPPSGITSLLRISRLLRATGAVELLPTPPPQRPPSPGGIHDVTLCYAKTLSGEGSLCRNNVTPERQAADSLWDLFLAKHNVKGGSRVRLLFVLFTATLVTLAIGARPREVYFQGPLTPLNTTPTFDKGYLFVYDAHQINARKPGFTADLVAFSRSI